jgi:hypothetical protein
MEQKIQSSPGGDSIDLLIASPAVETAGYFHSPFGIGCFPLRAVVFETDYLRHGKQRICLQFGDTTDHPFSDLSYCRMPASEMPKARRADENSPLFQQRERVQKTEKSPQGTTEIFDIPRNASSEDQALSPICKIATFQMILDETKDSVVPWRGLDWLLIASPAVETAGYFHSPFRAWMFQIGYIPVALGE